eukprot:scaffold57506_cov63-Cyclotella_meneghiniana.AAC.1
MKRFTVWAMPSSSRMSIVFWGAILAFSVLSINNEHVLLSSLFRFSDGNLVKLHVPSGLDTDSTRRLSLNLGDGACMWEPPLQEVPTTIDFWKTAIVGFPSGDKRMTFMQMEALTGWPAKDEWDFEYLGDSNHPFIKANYPHHEGIWGWGTNADQVVMVVKNIRKALVEYHDILWDIGYAETYEEATLNLDKLYSERPPVEDFREWRDLRITTPEHYNMLMMPHNFKREELDYDLIVGADTVVTPTYDPHCQMVTNGCKPVAIFSAEKLLSYSEGPEETASIANVLMGNEKMSPHVIEQEAWDCIWDELIVKKKGARTILNRPNTNYTEDDYNFSSEMIEAMIAEIDRLLDKYSSTEWMNDDNADRLVQLLTGHRSELLTEMHEVNTGVRKLNSHDFLGPQERELLRKQSDGSKPNLDYFKLLEQERARLKKLAPPNKNKVDLKTGEDSTH